MNGQHKPPLLGKGFIPGTSVPQMAVSNMTRPPPAYSGNSKLPDKTHQSILQSKHPFGWTSIDNIAVPYIMRGLIKFVSVKMVENKLLSKYPKINMSDMNNVGPIYSYYISDTEAKLLTEISSSYNQGLNIKPFSTKDLIVSLEDFERFYDRAKQHFSVKGQSTSKGKGHTSKGLPDMTKSNVVSIPGSNIPHSNPINIQVPPLRPATASFISPTAALSSQSLPPAAALSIPPAHPALSSPSAPIGALSSPTAQAIQVSIPHNISNPPQPITIFPSYPQQTEVVTVNTAQNVQMSIPHRLTGGWVQINNTVVPYLLRNDVKYVPLSVIKYAAGLLTDMKINGYKVPVTEQEYEYLNDTCKSAGVNFTFSIKTKIIKLELVTKMSHSKVVIHELPTSDPFTYAQWREEHAGNQLSSIKANGPINVISPTGVHQVPPKNPFLHPDTSSGSSLLPMKPPLIPIESMSPEAVQAIGFQSRDLQTPSPYAGASSFPLSDSASVSSAFSSRPPSVQSRKSITPPMSPRQSSIKSLQFEGKTVSCLIRHGEKEPLALLEALVRLYFAQCSLTEFQSALQNVLKVPIHQLTSEEEAAFISFYGLKVKSLRCKSIISFDKFKIFYVQLKYIFANKATCTISSPEKQSLVVAAKSADVQNNNKDIEVNNSSVVNGNGLSPNVTVNGDSETINLQVDSPSVPLNGESNSTITNGSSPLTLMDTSSQQQATGASGSGSMKRKSTSSGHSRKSKFPKRLEDTVAMLKQRNETVDAEFEK